MPYDDRSSFARTGIRIVRVVVPWVGLLIVLLVLWSFVTDYRTAADSNESTATVEATQTPGVVLAGEPYVQVLSDGLNLRAEPSTTAAVVKVLSADQQLAFIEEGIGWYRVRDAEGIEGWVAAGGRYTELIQP
ncbi:MAG: SH3 domain-containing protein [Coriobacteriia bacterium]|nr:SH3 domain-containing protein [Coriobacteriia bacterium]